MLFYWVNVFVVSLVFFILLDLYKFMMVDLFVVSMDMIFFKLWFFFVNLFFFGFWVKWDFLKLLIFFWIVVFLDVCGVIINFFNNVRLFFEMIFWCINKCRYEYRFWLFFELNFFLKLVLIDDIVCFSLFGFKLVVIFLKSLLNWGEIFWGIIVILMVVIFYVLICDMWL